MSNLRGNLCRRKALFSTLEVTHCLSIILRGYFEVNVLVCVLANHCHITQVRVLLQEPILEDNTAKLGVVFNNTYAFRRLWLRTLLYRIPDCFARHYVAPNAIATFQRYPSCRQTRNT